jgi:cytochrome o ubiquinol oxidase subunit 2
VLAWPIALAPLLGGCSVGVLDPQGPVGAADVQIMLNALAVMLAIVVPTLVAVLSFAVWFRAANSRARYRLHFVYSGQIELLVWGIPALAIVFLGGLIWIGSHRLDPARPLDAKAHALDVQVVSLDWKWLFIYPAQGIASVNTLTVPAGVPVHFSLTSASVLNVFFVPQLGSMIYAMSGMVTQLYLQADRPGDFYGQSAMFSGDGFSSMHFVVHAVPADTFGAWAAGVRKAGPVLDRGAYAALSRQSQDVAPYTYRAVDAGLFADVARLAVPPGTGPAVGAGGREHANTRPED